MWLITWSTIENVRYEGKIGQLPGSNDILFVAYRRSTDVIDGDVGHEMLVRFSKVTSISTCRTLWPDSKISSQHEGKILSKYYEEEKGSWITAGEQKGGIYIRDMRKRLLRGCHTWHVYGAVIVGEHNTKASVEDRFMREVNDELTRFVAVRTEQTPGSMFIFYSAYVWFHKLQTMLQCINIFGKGEWRQVNYGLTHDDAYNANQWRYVTKGRPWRVGEGNKVFKRVKKKGPQGASCLPLGCGGPQAEVKGPQGASCLPLGCGGPQAEVKGPPEMSRQTGYAACMFGPTGQMLVRSGRRGRKRVYDDPQMYVRRPRGRPRKTDATRVATPPC